MLGTCTEREFVGLGAEQHQGGGEGGRVTASREAVARAGDTAPLSVGGHRPVWERDRADSHRGIVSEPHMQGAKCTRVQGEQSHCCPTRQLSRSSTVQLDIVYIHIHYVYIHNTGSLPPTPPYQGQHHQVCEAAPSSPVVQVPRAQQDLHPPTPHGTDSRSSSHTDTSRG